MFLQFLLLHSGEVTVWAWFGLKFAPGSFVVTNIPQVTHPLAPIGCEGTLHPQRLDSTVVEVIWHAGEWLTAGWAYSGFFNTLLTEEVATTGLNWFQHNLKAYRTLQSLQVLFCLFHKQVLLPFVRERELQGGGHFVVATVPWVGKCDNGMHTVCTYEHSVPIRQHGPCRDGGACIDTMVMHC